METVVNDGEGRTPQIQEPARFTVSLGWSFVVEVHLGAVDGFRFLVSSPVWLDFDGMSGAGQGVIDIDEQDLTV